MWCRPSSGNCTRRKARRWNFPGVIPAEMLQVLREECSYFLGYFDSDHGRQGCGGRRTVPSRQAVFHQQPLSPEPAVWQFLFSPLMAEIARAALGPDVYLFHEQWVVKGPSKA